MSLWEAIAGNIEASGAGPVSITGTSPVAGGCINQAHRLRGPGSDYFVKLNDAARLDMFAAEAEGLGELEASRCLRVPRVVCWGESDGSAYLVLEYIELGGSSREGMRELGAGLAAMHRVTRSRYGWRRGNTIGSTAQCNTLQDDWTEFWREHRLGYQLRLAAENRHGGRLQSSGEHLMGLLPALFADYRPTASLLHGDLWSGNYSMDKNGEPVIFDPAVYYGDRETDLAMTELFGGFGQDFYGAYNDVYPIEPGYEVRKNLYNLYHILNHLNLFGGGYLSQSQGLIDRLLAELR